MGWQRMVGAGMGFLGIGIWRVIAGSSEISGSSSKSRSIRHCDLQAIVVAILSFFHTLSSIIAFYSDSKSGYLVSSAMSLEISGAALMFLVYALAEIVKEKTSLLPLPKETLRFLAITAFGMEFFLFYVRDPDELGVESQYHRLLLVPIGICFVATCLRIAYSTTELLRLVQNMGLVLQGTWFLQMAFSLFSSSGIAHGCWLDSHGAEDSKVHCKGMDLMRGKATATLQFNLHLATLLICVIPVHAFFNRDNGTTSSTSYEQLHNSEFQMSETRTSVSNGLHPATYVLEEEDV